MIESFGNRKKRGVDDKEDDDMWEMGNDFNEGFKKADYSVGHLYPQPYCEKVNQLSTECFQESLLELWAYKGAFDASSDKAIATLTKKEILYRINSGNYR